MPASGPLTTTQEPAGEALAVAHAALMQARLHCKLQEPGATTRASPRREWGHSSPGALVSQSRFPHRFLSPGNGDPTPVPAPLGLWPFGPFPDTFLSGPLPLQPMMKLGFWARDCWRTEAWRIRSTSMV